MRLPMKKINFELLNLKFKSNSKQVFIIRRSKMTISCFFNRLNRVIQIGFSFGAELLILFIKCRNIRLFQI